MLENVWYVPALRMKEGELKGLRDLEDSVATHILPRLIVPPAKERADKSQPILDIGERCPRVDKVGAYWNRRPVLLDCSYILDEFGRNEPRRWLPGMFASARKNKISAIPLVGIEELCGENRSVYADLIDRAQEICLGIIIPFEMVEDVPALSKLNLALLDIGVNPQNCIIISDFSSADLSVTGVEMFISRALEILQDFARWGLVAFQGGSFPDENPAQPDSSYMVERHDWSSWCNAVKFDKSTADHLLYGDFAADCAVIEFRNGRARPIPHFRYTTDKGWLVQRGKKQGSYDPLMQDVSRKVLSSGHFHGRDFSPADDLIYRLAHGISRAGKPTDWRAVNTTHHLTKIINDIAKIKGVELTRRKVQDFALQIEMAL